MPGERAPEAVGRRRAAGALIGAAVLCALLALVLSYSSRALLRAQPFADRAVATLRDPAVQRDVADRLTGAIVRAGNGDLVAVRPLIRSFAGAIVGGEAFAALFRRGVLEAHHAVIERKGGTIQLNVADSGVLVAGALQRIDPRAARTIGAERLPGLLSFHPDGPLLGISRAAARARAAAWILALLAVLAALGALRLTGDRRRSAQQLGAGIALGGLTLVALLLVGRLVAENAASPGRSAVVGAAWRVFFGGLRVQALWLAAAGTVCAAAASGRVRAPRIEQRLARGLRVLTGAQPTRGRRLGRALGLAAAGIAIILDPPAALTLAALAAGLYLLYKGVEALLAETALAPGEAQRGRQPRAGLARAGRTARRWVRPLLAAAALAGVVAIVATGEGDGAPAVPPLTCNGHDALCDRRLNDVALAATHNSMASVTIPTWLFGQQDGTISEQLEDGIRGLLIDTYHGAAVPGGVRTELGRIDSAKREAAVREVGAPAVEAALRIRSRLGHQGRGKPGIFLCHTFCELGSVTLGSALSDLRSFLVAHPGEVLVMVNQDEGVSPAEMQRAFEQAGLLDLVYRGPAGPFPTLRTMIDSDQRLLVLAENEADPSVPWYHLAFQHALKETPYRFRAAAQLTDPAELPASCAPNRGPESAPLFLVNSWVDTSPTPRPSLAAKVNAREALLKRARTCERIRGQIPNLIAVDFYRLGDLLGVIDTLNGVAPGG
jgi:hypothetical protein